MFKITYKVKRTMVPKFVGSHEICVTCRVKPDQCKMSESSMYADYRRYNLTPLDFIGSKCVHLNSFRITVYILSKTRVYKLEKCVTSKRTVF